MGRKTHELKRNGASIVVTSANREEFVQLYVDFIWNQSVKAAFAAFLGGFEAVVERGAILLFRPEELQELVIGSQILDFHELEKVTQYDGGFEATSSSIVHFWEIVHRLSNDDKKKLLFFTTGSDRVPAGGLTKLQFMITRNGPDS
ncbi:Ubiquitin-protein ligase E3A [Irineochytrium annulatum]|nr:Ubiquitin-protein ligase E3A [Irineochytrium annulatum]